MEWSLMPFPALKRAKQIGLIFDVDGLLVENTYEIMSAYRALLDRRGITPVPGEEFPGCDLFDILLGIKTKYGLREGIEQLASERKDAYLDILRNSRLNVCEGVAELLVSLERHRTPNLRLAYASSSEKCFTTIIFSQLFSRIGLPKYASQHDRFFFDQNQVPASTCWQAGLQKKPHPMLYELTCQKLGLAPDQCLAFEDSTSGYEAALEAGLNLIIVPNRQTEREFAHLAFGRLYQQRIYKIHSLREVASLIGFNGAGRTSGQQCSGSILTKEG